MKGKCVGSREDVFGGKRRETRLIIFMFYERSDSFGDERIGYEGGADQHVWRRGRSITFPIRKRRKDYLDEKRERNHWVKKGTETRTSEFVRNGFECLADLTSDMFLFRPPT